MIQSNIKLADAYYRLSVEESKEGESESIKNQRNIVRQYCEDNDIILVKEFTDDGYSGSNFDRPGFNEMLDHIATGKVNMVITKDLSRLGRDMTESSFYAERFFPEHFIRYVAISDNFDSNATNVMAPFQFAMNDVYLRETSRKIKQVFNQKRNNGDYCACPPFGYKKAPNEKGRLIPDPMTAPIVSKIFELACEGKTIYKIATILTESGAITPLRYRVEYRDNFCEKGAERATDKWNSTTVKRILKNRVYLGHTILGKTKKVSYKSKVKYKVPEEEQSVSLNTHIPLVSQEQFDKANNFIGMHTKAAAENERCRISIFNGIAVCQSCGGAMCSSGTVYKGDRTRYWFLSCQNIPKRAKNHCEHGARIRYDDLLQIVKSELDKLISLSDEEIDKIVKKATGSNSGVYNSSKDEKIAIENRLKAIDKILFKLYNDNAAGIVSDEQLETMAANFSKETKSLKTRLFELTTLTSENDEKVSSYEAFFNLTKQYNHIDELTPEIVRTFIEKIEIGPKIYPDGVKPSARGKEAFTQQIKIRYRFIGNIDGDELCIS